MKHTLISKLYIVELRRIGGAKKNEKKGMVVSRLFSHYLLHS